MNHKNILLKWIYKLKCKKYLPLIHVSLNTHCLAVVLKEIAKWNTALGGDCLTEYSSANIRDLVVSVDSCGRSSYLDTSPASRILLLDDRDARFHVEATLVISVIWSESKLLTSYLYDAGGVRGSESRHTVKCGHESRAGEGQQQFGKSGSQLVHKTKTLFWSC
jgi:hypothetical protein